ncbi:MAG: cytochrome B [Alphaproteobacteria bacterium HGW-Alphaproteobacteria-13]|jgi:cytochrome b561|nr:MAG: cytochrome B [Alphaproteobacteria bacterium HGW-Alphaproteobacteria-13]
MATAANAIDAGMSGQQRYTKVASSLHWLIAIAVIVNIGLAMLTEGQPREIRGPLMGIHKAIGITILALTILRILWRFGHKAPPPPPTMARWERVLSRGVHVLFYLLLLGLPLSGWIWMSAADRPIDFFGLFMLPSIAVPDEAVADAMHARHEVMGLTLVALVVLHIAAALKHQFVNRDGLIGRMNPF